MKRITLVILLFLLTGVGYSQFTENFEGGIPTNWAVFNNGFGTNTWTTTTSVTTPPTVCEGTTAAFMNARQNIGAGNTSENWLVTQQVQVPANGQLFFQTRSTISGPNNTTYEIRLSTTSQTNTGSFITVQSWTEAELNETFNICEDKQVNLAGFAGNNVYIAFVIVMNQPTAGLTGDRWIVDEVRLVEQCIDPENIVVNGITQTSALISWDNPGGATEFEVSVVPAPGAPVAGTVTSNNPYLAQGLSPTTQYQVYVRAKCEFSSSEWVGPVNFITTTPGQACSSAIQVAALPYFTTDNTSNYLDDIDGSPGASGCGATGNYLNGNNVYYSYTATTTGVINITMTPTGNNSGVFVYNSCANVGVSCIAGAANTGGGPRVIDLPVTQGQTYYIVISTNGNPNTIPFTLSIQVVNCPPPTNLTAVGGQTSAVLGWDANAATSWEYAVQVLGGVIPPGAGVQTNANQNVTVTNLLDGTPIQAATQYQYWVRRDCGDGTFSAWAGPFLFNTTICEPADQCVYTFRMRDSVGDGWNGARMQVRQNGIVIATIGETFTAGAGPIDIQVSLCTGIPFDLFWSVGGTWSNEVRVEIFNSPIFNQSLYAMTVASAPLVGTVLYAGTVDCNNPACLPPTGVVVNNISDTSANVSWTPIPGVTQYEVIVLLNGSPAPTPASTGTVTSDNPFLIEGLTSGTIYNVYIRAICATPTPSNWTPVKVFNTTICQISEQCNYTFRLNDSFGDGWNGATMQVRQNGIVVATIGATFTAGAGPINIIVPLCNNLPFDLFWNAGGNFPAEIRVAIINDSNQQVFNMNVASAGLVGTILYTDNLVECGVPECLPPTGITFSAIGDSSANVSWTPIPGITNFEVIVLPAGSPAPTATSTGTVTTDNPFTIEGLTAATIYDVYVRALCTTSPSNWTPVSSFNTTICAVADQCNYIFRLRDSFGDGWNGGLMQVRQNGIIVATIGGTFNNGAGPVNIQVPLCNNLPFELFWSVPGTFPAEVRVEIINPFGQSLYNMNVASAGLVGTILYSGNVDCLNPECLAPFNVVTSNIGINQVSVGWTPNGGTNFEVIALPAGSPAPTAATPGIPATSNPFIVTGLTAGTAYDFYVRTLCTGVNPTSTWAGPATATTLPTCPAPINLIVIGADTNTATLSWTNIAPATLFEVVVQAVGAGIPATAGVITSQNPYTATGLSAGFYEFYVRAICSPTDKSAWAGPQNFFILAALPGCAGVDIDLQTSTPGVLNLCPGENCVDLTASFFETGDTTTYNITSIPVTPPVPFTGGIPTSVNTDDVWSPAIDLPFNFCFFGQNYTKALVGSNGVISFDIQGVVPGGAQEAGLYCAWPFTQTIPNVGFPIKAAIYGPYQDINPNVTTPPAQPSINYQVLGTAPCRVLVVNFSQLAQYSCNTNVPLQTSQIVLYETSNAIEIYVQNRVPCLNWNSGNGVLGIQNQAGTQAHVPPGRNTGTWSASNEAWRFTPAGPSNVTFSWLKDGEFYSSDLSINVCVSETTSMTAQAIYAACGGGETITTDTILLNIIGEELPVQDDVTVCATVGYELPILAIGNYFTEAGGQGQPLSAGDIITENTTIYVYLVISGTNGDCTSEGSFEVTMTDEIVPEFDAIPNICLNGTAPDLPATSLNGITGLWTPSTVDTSVVGTVEYVFEPFGSAECATSTTLTVTVIEETTPLFDPIVTAYCLNATPDILAEATNGITGTWSPSIIDTSVAIVDAPYVFTPDEGQCALPVTLLITVASEIVPTFDPISVCQGADAPILSDTSLEGVTGTWDGLIDTSVAGQFDFTFTPDATFECAIPVTITVEVIVPFDTAFDPISVTYCIGATADELPTTSLNGVLGSWSPSTIDTSVAVNDAEYVFTPDEGQCASTFTLLITINDEIVPTFDPIVTAYCLNASPDVLTTSTNGITGSWSPATIDTSVAVVDVPYTFTPDAGQCAESLTLLITVSTEIVPTFDPISICQGSEAPVLPTTSLEGITGQWNGTIDTSTAGEFTFTFEPDSTFECAIATSLIVEVKPTIAATFDAITTTYCQNATPDALPTSNNSVPGTWEPAIIDTATLGDATYVFTPDATIECAIITELVITISTPVTATFDAIAPICQNGASPTLPLESTNGVTGSWLPSTVDTTIVGTTTYVFIADPNQCALGTSLEITIQAPQTATFAQIASLCQGSTAPQLPVSSIENITGVWNPSTINTQQVGPTTYTFTPTAGLCAIGTTMTIEVFATPTADVVQNATACLSDGGFELQPLSSGNSYYTGPGATGQQLNLPYSVTESQTIYVYAQSGTTPNCFNETSFTVTIVEVMAQDLSDVEECGKYTLPELNAGNAYYTGPNGTGTPLQPGSDVTTSQLIYIYATNNGCSAQSDFQVTIKNCTIQKGISPNNDGSNDYFDLANYNVSKLEIFNRYGLKVYSKNNYENEWYGQTDKGDDLPDGTYYFVIYFTEGTNTTGWIYVNRVR